MDIGVLIGTYKGGSEEQIITHYSIHQKSNDMNVLSTHLEIQDSTLSEKIEKVCLDTGYGSEENYELLDSKQIDAGQRMYSKGERKKNNPWI